MSDLYELLDKLFNDPKTGLVGEDKLFRRAKALDSAITRKVVKQYLKENEIHQVFQKPKQTIPNPKIHGKVGHYQKIISFIWDQN